MQATSPLNTAVNLMIEVNGLRLHLKGTVKTSHRMQGMGIDFTEIPDADLPQLEEIIRQLASGQSDTQEPRPSGGPDLLMIVDPSAALHAVGNFFQTHRMLTREEFKELVGASQNRNGEQAIADLCRAPAHAHPHEPPPGCKLSLVSIGGDP